jgi:hypothetical protein
MARNPPARVRRFLGATGLVASTLCAALPARAEEPAFTRPAPPPIEHAGTPDTALAFVTGASVLLLGMGVGASLIGADHGRTEDIAGWMVMQSSFAVAPLAAHAVVGEWGRGLLFATPPLATTAGTAAVFGVDSNAVRHSPLSEQRVLWACFVAGLFSGAYGVVDSTFADDRRVTITPVVGMGTAGIDVRGTL